MVTAFYDSNKAEQPWQESKNVASLREYEEDINEKEGKWNGAKAAAALKEAAFNTGRHKEPSEVH